MRVPTLQIAAGRVTLHASYRILEFERKICLRSAKPATLGAFLKSERGKK